MYESTLEGDADLFSAKYAAATPATCGDAIDVPDIVCDPPPREVDTILLPGANISTTEP